MAEEQQQQKEVCARCCFSPPVCSYAVRSWCNRWLSCSSAAGDVSFASWTLASRFLLLPQADGRYKLQLVSEDGEGKPWFVSARDSSVRMSSDCTSDEALLFTLQLDEHGRVSLSAGGGFLSTDRNGCFWSGSSAPRKWELFTLFEQVVQGYREEAPWVVQAPVRVTLQASNGKFLCASKPVVGVGAEAPCCCEEFLIDLWFSSLPPPKTEEAPHVRPSFLRSLFGRPVEEPPPPSRSSHCTIRTADGACLLSAGPDGNVVTTHVNRAQGRETFSAELRSDGPCPRISIQQAAAERRYLSAEYGHLVNRRAHRRACDYFNVQLANGSRVLLRSIHGGFLGAYSGSLRAQYCCGDVKQAVETLGAWSLRAHGDSYYTLTSASTLKRGADVYMFADSAGRIYQSSNPRVHFPAVASLFEIKPVSNAGIMPKFSSTSIIGFTIRTARKINGKQRYLSVEPNGSLRAVKLSPSRWELFQIIDVDAASAAAAPQTFCCVPASFNRQPPAAHGPVLSRVSLPVIRATGTDSSRSLSVVKACEVAALAVTGGQAVPRKSSASLQELCITQVCCHAAGTLTEDNLDRKSGFTEPAKICPTEDEFSELVVALCSLARSHELLPVNIPSEFAENAFNIPDDLLTRIWSTCRLRQVPKDSCKWLPSAFVPQSQGHRHRFGPRTQRSALVEGWHCSSCDQGNVLPMDAAVNPAHRRYLEVYSRAIHSTGVLWNLISLAGVSIMSTALFCQLKAVAGRRSGSQNSF